MINKHYVKWKKSDIKTIHYTFPFIGNASTHRKYLEKENLQRHKQIFVCLALGVETEIDSKWTQGNFGGRWKYAIMKLSAKLCKSGKKNIVHLKWVKFVICEFIVVVVQSLSHIRLFVTPRTAVHQAPLSSTISQSLPKSMSIESVMLSISSSAAPFSFCLQCELYLNNTASKKETTQVVDITQTVTCKCWHFCLHNQGPATRFP